VLDHAGALEVPDPTEALEVSSALLCNRICPVHTLCCATGNNKLLKKAKYMLA